MLDFSPVFHVEKSEEVDGDSRDFCIFCTYQSRGANVCKWGLMPCSPVKGKV